MAQSVSYYRIEKLATKRRDVAITKQFSKNLRDQCSVPKVLKPAGAAYENSNLYSSYLSTDKLA